VKALRLKQIAIVEILKTEKCFRVKISILASPEPFGWSKT